MRAYMFYGFKNERGEVVTRGERRETRTSLTVKKNSRRIRHEN